LVSRAWISEPAVGTPARGGLVAAFSSTFAMTLTNPTTIISFAAIFAGFGVAEPGISAARLVAGVFLGSASWWLILSLAVGRLRVHVRPYQLTWVNRVSGSIILGFGGLALASLLV
jgi:threonine/homoserine/homoserine lactone efflux protein